MPGIFIGWELGLVLLDLPTATPDPTVYPNRSNGLAAYLVGGFFGLGLLVLVMVLLSSRPRRADPPTRND